MIELSRSHEPVAAGTIKVVGVGGAGSHAVDRISREGIAGVELIVTNTDARGLSGAVTAQKIGIGRALTRGLGAGGDPEVGAAAARESAAELADKLAGASLLIIVTGLGGGTSSGAAPVIAQIGRDLGAHVVVVATLPFSFEGRRRRDQASDGIKALRACSDLVVCFENERMSSIAGTSAGVLDAFAAVDGLLAQAVRSLSAMTRRRNVLSGGIAEIAAAVGGSSATALFGFGIAEGENRGAGALARALESPLLDKGKKLKEATSLWVHVAGGDDMRWAEVQSLMVKASEMTAQDVKMFFGASVDSSLVGTMAVTLIAGVPDACEPAFADLVVSCGSGEPERVESKRVNHPAVVSDGRVEQNEGMQISQTRKAVSVPPFEKKQEVQADVAYVPQISVTAVATDTVVVNESVSRDAMVSATVNESPVFVEPPASSAEVEAALEKFDAHESEALISSQIGNESVVQSVIPVVAEPEGAVKKKETVQEQMSFEPVSRGRFEKTDPTIVDGEDLDIPTFMRQRKD